MNQNKKSSNKKNVNKMSPKISGNMGDWSKVKMRIKTKFTKLNESDLESLNGHLDRLPEKVQKLYGYTKDKAAQECKEFVRAA